MKLFQNVWFCFLVIVLLVIIANQGYITFFFRPCSYHLWRQSDGASYALNYFQHNLSFLPPQVHHRFALDGRAVSELPIVYYVAAKLYKVFGFHDYFIRLIHFAMFLIGLAFLIRITTLYTKNIVLQLLPFALTITSPYLFYYGANFLPDVAALSMAIVGLYFFLRFDKSHSTIHLVLFCLFYTFATLLKVSDIILFIASLATMVVNRIKYKSYYSGSKPQKTVQVIIISCSFAIIGSWVAYAKYVAAHYQFGGNLLGFMGIWDLEKDEWRYILGCIISRWMPVILSKYVWLLTFVAFTIIAFLFRRLGNTLLCLLLFTALGSLLYLICFFKVFDVHDYYLINIFCLIALIFIAAVSLLDSWVVKLTANRKKLLLVFVTSLFIYSVYKSAYMQRYRYFEPEYNSFNTDYYNLEPYLRSLGIRSNDLVMSVPDPSPNITLYLMNQIGYTECYNSEEYNINYFVKKAGVKYLIVSDTAYLQKELYKPYCLPQNKLGQYKSIAVYKTAL